MFFDKIHWIKRRQICIMRVNLIREKGGTYKSWILYGFLNFFLAKFSFLYLYIIYRFLIHFFIYSLHNLYSLKEFLAYDTDNFFKFNLITCKRIFNEKHIVNLFFKFFNVVYFYLLFIFIINSSVWQTWSIVYQYNIR